MKRLIYTFFLPLFVASVHAQQNKTEVLQDLESNQPVYQDATATATLKSACRLFADKNDLTSVIRIIPAGSVVNVLEEDSTYLKVAFEEDQGYIYTSKAVVNKNSIARETSPKQEQIVRSEAPVRHSQMTGRLADLEAKYGFRIAQKIYQGKIWKGMTGEMVKDSWGSPRKINRVINGNIVKEDWTYSDTWLYFQNNTLVGWGPIRQGSSNN